MTTIERWDHWSTNDIVLLMWLTLLFIPQITILHVLFDIKTFWFSKYNVTNQTFLRLRKQILKIKKHK